MKSLRDYLDILTQLDERVTPDGKGGFTGGLTPQPAAPAAPADDWESSPVAGSKLTPQQTALAQGAGMATTPAQMATLAKQNMVAAQSGQPISATPKPQIPATPAAAAPATPAAAAPATPATPAAAAPAAPAKPAGAPNPWEGKDPAKAAAWATMSPEDQKWLGGADPTDKFILARSPNKGKATAAPAASAPATPATPAAAPALTAADQEDADMGKAMAANAQAATQAANGVNAAGQNVTMPDGTNPETGEKTTVANAAPAGPEGAAKPAAPASRDAMPFGKAFADAKAKGEKTFMWKGKSYAVQMAASAQGAKKTAPALPGKAAPAGGATGTMGASDPMTGMPYSPMAENSSYDEVQRLVSLVQYR